MAFKEVIALSFIGFFAQNTAFLIHGDSNQGHVTTLGPLGTDATLSVLLKEVFDLKEEVRNQAQEIQTLKALHTFGNNVTSGPLIQQMSEDIHRLDVDLSKQNRTILAMGSNLTAVQTSLQSVNEKIDYLFDYRIHLVNGSNSNSGRVELFHLRQWWTVCDDGFDTNAAKVVCRMLGKSTTNAVAYGKAHFGQGKGNILMDDLVCTGTELDLSKCKHNDLGMNDCGHDEDAGVYCG
uniref:Scavenger receptor cysteine-rich type 1 protein M130-like n=1 Tax=Crassostrea virginica TaxID=6565 RepID=A0A8B8CBH8_CRAVI|nr:scavenger receptor cysteine-rich type 1 protein M130-like [Crassostrea virginica]